MSSASEKKLKTQLVQVSGLPVPKVEKLPEDLKKYFRVCEEKLGFIPNVLRAFSLIPEKLRTFNIKYNELMLSEDSPLNRLEKEMIAVVVSSYNHCVYCITSHSQSVRELSGDPILADILVTNYRAAQLSARQRVILDYAWKMTSIPQEVCEVDRQVLSDFGFKAEEIFEINDVIAYFNYTNRMTHGIGIEPNKEYFGMNR